MATKKAAKKAQEGREEEKALTFFNVTEGDAQASPSLLCERDSDSSGHMGRAASHRRCRPARGHNPGEGPVGRRAYESDTS